MQNSDQAFLDGIFSAADAITPEGSTILSGMGYFRVIDAEGNTTFVWREFEGDIEGTRQDVSVVVGDLHRIAFALMEQNYVLQDGTHPPGWEPPPPPLTTYPIL